MSQLTPWLWAAITLAIGLGLGLLLLSTDDALNVLDYRIFAGLAVAVAALACLWALLDLKDDMTSRTVAQSLYIAAEVSKETGPGLRDYIEAISSYHHLLSVYSKCTSQRVEWARRALVSIPEDLNEPVHVASNMFSSRVSSLAEAQRSVQEAGRWLGQSVSSFHNEVGIRQGRRPLVLVTCPGIGVLQVNQAIQKFHNSVDVCVQERTVERCKRACIGSRISGAKAHAFLLASNRAATKRIQLEQFAVDLQRFHKTLLEVAAEQPGVDFLYSYAESVERRLRALEAVKSENAEGLWCALLPAALRNRELGEFDFNRPLPVELIPEQDTITQPRGSLSGSADLVGQGAAMAPSIEGTKMQDSSFKKGHGPSNPEEGMRRLFEELEALRVAFNELLPELRKTHLGKYVAICEGALIDADSDYDALSKRLDEREPLGRTIIQKVQEGDPVPVVIEVV